jgi:hypothetical protein
VDAATLKEMLERSFELTRTDPEKGHDIYAEDAVLEFPQSGERFEGVQNFREWRSQYPADVSFDYREIRGRDDLWVVELTLRYDEGADHFGVSVIELDGERIVRETIYVAEGWDPPEWRAKWRAAP